MGYEVAIIDLETLSVYDDSIILSLGIVIADATKKATFQELIQKSLFLKFDVKEQKDLGRKVLPSTLEWWVDQVEEAKKISFYPDPKRDISIMEISNKIIDYCKHIGIDKNKVFVWSRSIGFEKGKINHVIETLGLEQIFSYKNYLDVVTLCHITEQNRYAGINVKDYVEQGFIYHHPTHDAVLDFLRLQKVMVESNMITLQ